MARGQRDEEMMTDLIAEDIFFFVLENLYSTPLGILPLQIYTKMHLGCYHPTQSQCQLQTQTAEFATIDNHKNLCSFI